MIRTAAFAFPILVLIAACSTSPSTSGTSSTAGGTGGTGTTSTGSTGGTTSTGSTSTTSTGSTGGTTSTGGADAGSDAGTGSSQGQGGLPCSSTGVASQGGVNYSYCVASVGEVEMKIVEPKVTGTGPLRLAVYLHGDGAGPYTTDLALRKLAPWTSQHNVLLVAARAPNACAWWLVPSYTVCDGVTPIPNSAVDTGGENAAALKAAIDAIRAGWDIADSPVLFGGSSGGSIFLSASFLPTFGDKYPGAYALSCGGEAPWDGGLAWDDHDPAKVGASKLFFTYGDKDFVVPDVLDAVAYYQTTNIPVDIKVIPETVAAGTSHCGNVGGSYSYDQIGRVADVWSSYLGQ